MFAAVLSVTTLCLVWNFVSSISIIFVNKWIYTYHKFPNVTLTCFHFLLTWLGLVICHIFGVFHRKSVHIKDILPLAFSFCGFVVLTNLSLQYNTVGTYQLMKTMTSPFIIIIQTIYYNRTFSTKVKLTLIPIVMGVFLNSYFDLKFSLIGVAYGLIGVVVTSLYQILVGEKQKELQLNSMQLLFYQAPLSIVLLCPVILAFEPLFGEQGLVSNWPKEATILIVLSGVIAFSVNLSIYWIIGNTSPLTYNMFGHLKFCSTVIGGFLIFKDPLTLMQSSGILLTFGGVLAYTWFKLKEEEEKKKQLPT